MTISPRVAVEGYAGSQLLGDVAIDIVVPKYVLCTPPMLRWSMGGVLGRRRILDKPMRGHGLMQVIARVNRIFKDKPGGLAVDYLGLADELRQALVAYTEDDQRQTGIPQEEAVEVLLEKIRSRHGDVPRVRLRPLPHGHTCAMIGCVAGCNGFPTASRSGAGQGSLFAGGG